MTETLGTSQGVSPRAPESPRTTLSQVSNEVSVNGVNDYSNINDKNIMNCHSDISTPSYGNANTKIYVDFSLRHKHNINITNEIEEEKREASADSSRSRGYRSTVWVDKDSWQRFILLCRDLGYSASEVINAFVKSIVNSSDFVLNSRIPLNFNIAIAKSEAKPVISIGEYLTLRRLDETLSQVPKLKERAKREVERGAIFSFTIERARALEEEIIKTLKGLKSRSLDPEKLQEVEAALSILKSIREGKA
ncbi:MAG: hypothetical protein QXG08_06355 [Candidatus Methanomethyliaceae archaeon]